MSLRTLANNVARVAHGLSGTAVILTGPDGIPRTYTDCIFLSGRVTTSPDSGEETVVVNPVASFPRSSLVVIPQNGENWHLQAPLDPDNPLVYSSFEMTPTKSIEGGRSLDTIILHVSEGQQS